CEHAKTWSRHGHPVCTDRGPRLGVVLHGDGLGKSGRLGVELARLGIRLGGVMGVGDEGPCLGVGLDADA
ncbi:hypothetical protein PIB30_108699, partial [Stylosanthes scabra]|nr:hypothetical protein [Stylosanthes scabra]